MVPTELTLATDHLDLLKDKVDMDAITDPKVDEKEKKDDLDDDLLAMMGNLGIESKCSICFTMLVPMSSLHIDLFSPFSPLSLVSLLHPSNYLHTFLDKSTNLFQFHSSRHLQSYSDNSITTGKQRCLDCEQNLEKVFLAQPDPGRRTSSKIRKVLEILKTPIDEDHQVKTIIFSQFTSMLDVIEPFLRDHGIIFGRCRYPTFHSISVRCFHSCHSFSLLSSSCHCPLGTSSSAVNSSSSFLLVT